MTIALTDRADLTGRQEVELTILMPCLNEAETIAACIVKAQAFLGRSGVVGEVLIADNGSTDGSREIALALGARVEPVAARGYGSALLGGIAAARGRYTIMGDADDSYDFASLDLFLERLRQGCDLVMGNRFKGGIRAGAMPFLHRYLGNPVLSALGRRLYRVPIGDFHCGLRGFRTAGMRAIGLHLPGMEFASEMVVKAALAGLAIAEVPTVLAPDGRSRPPHLRTWRDGWRHLRFLLLLCPRWLFLYPGLGLAALGAAGMASLLAGPRHLYGVELDVHTLVYCAAAIVVGFQVAAFALFAQYFGPGAGLAPRRSRLLAVAESWSLEGGLAIGALLTLAGIAGSIHALGIWSAQNYGDLDPSSTLRVVVPSATAIMLGLQMAFSSFLISMLSMVGRVESPTGG